MAMARYIMLRVSEHHGCVVSIDPKPAEGDWNGAGCHTNLSTKSMRETGGYDVIIKVCEAFGKVTKEHMDAYGGKRKAPQLQARDLRHEYVQVWCGEPRRFHPQSSRSRTEDMNLILFPHSHSS